MAAISLAAALAAAILLGVPARASASYPGRAGAIAFRVESLVVPGDRELETTNVDLYAVRPPSRHLRHLSDCPLGGGSSDTIACPVGALAFSPDGRQLAFAEAPPASGPCAKTICLAIASADGSSTRTLAPLTAEDADPAFLPGGHTLVFAGRPKPGARFDLYTAPSSGAGLTRLTSSGAQQPAPCANGSIAFVHRRDLYLLSPDHRSQRRLTLRGGNSPDCSPDGRWIAFVRHRDLYLISSTGRGVRRLTSHHVLDGGGDELARPAFAPTGTRIAFGATVACRSSGNCCSSTNPFGCGSASRRVTTDVEVIDLRGRVRTAATLSDTTNDSYAPFDPVGDVAWQPLSTR